MGWFSGLAFARAAGPTPSGRESQQAGAGPTVLIEYGNTQNDGNHALAVWRVPRLVRKLVGRPVKHTSAATKRSRKLASFRCTQTCRVGRCGVFVRDANGRPPTVCGPTWGPATARGLHRRATRRVRLVPSAARAGRSSRLGSDAMGVGAETRSPIARSARASSACLRSGAFQVRRQSERATTGFRASSPGGSGGSPAPRKPDQPTRLAEHVSCR